MHISTIPTAICAVVLIVLLGGCGKNEKAEKATEAGTQTEAAAAEPAEETPPAPMDPCEHDIPIYSCDECRYECGAVKVGDSLTASGLIRFDAARPGIDSSALHFSGVLALDDDRTARIAAPCDGNLAAITAPLGAKIAASAVVFTMNSVEYEKTAAEYIRSKRTVDVAGAAWARDSALALAKALSDRDAAESRTAFFTASAELRAAEKALLAFGFVASDLSALESGENSGPLRVRSPVSGTIISREGARGEHIDAERVVATVSDLSVLWAWFDVYEQDLARLEQARRSGPLQVSLAATAWPGRSFSGSVDWVGAEINAQTRTVRVRATIDNRDGSLRSGMFCTATAGAGAAPGERVIVSSLAVQSDAGRDFVFVPYVKGYCIRRYVEALPADGADRTILAGLAAGEKVVTDGAFLLKSDVLRDKMGAGCAD